MNSIETKQNRILALGDFVIMAFSLFIALYIRQGAGLDLSYIEPHILPFLILFILSLLVFYIVGLYEQHTVVFQKKIFSIIVQAQIVNAIMAISIFYFIPFFNVTPKTNLFTYLALSSVLVGIWRLNGIKIWGTKNKTKALLIGESEEAQSLMKEINENNRYRFFVDKFLSFQNLPENLTNFVKENQITMIIFEKANIPPQTLYKLMLLGIECIELNKLYEELYGRIPLSLVNENWLVQNISVTQRFTYNIIKRLFDIVAALIGVIFSSIFFPFIYIAVKIEDRGPIFIKQDRVGIKGKLIKIYKYRSMTSNDNGKYGEKGSVLKVTKVGAFLRKSRLDEFPQLFNVLIGDISIIGPRPEFPALVAKYEQDIPYYALRHIVKPGLSGWAQVYHEQHPHHGVDVEETKNKLSYDFYYIKHRSMFLDILISFKTLRVLFSFLGK